MGTGLPGISSFFLMYLKTEVCEYILPCFLYIRYLQPLIHRCHKLPITVWHDVCVNFESIIETLGELLSKME